MTTTTHTDHHQHELELKDYKKRYTCDGCKEPGFGSRYRCEDCDFDLHKDCMFNTRAACHDFFEGSTFEFFKEPPKKKNSKESERYCDACGKAINGFVYHCKEKNLDLHPCCLSLKNEMVINEVRFELKEKVTSKCIWCKKRNLRGSAKWIDGWSYVSNRDEYHFHVFCGTEMVAECLKSGHRSLDLEKLELPLERRRNRNGGTFEKCLKIVKVLLTTIASILLGDPILIPSTLVIDLITNF